MILDVKGLPIVAQDLKQPQTSKFASLKREFANHPSRGLTPRGLAAILESAEQGDLIEQANLFLDMEEKDAHIFAEMHKRKMAVSQLPWTIEPPSNATAQEKAQAAQLEEALGDLFRMEEIVFDLADAIGHGFACLEFTDREDTDGPPWVKADTLMVPSAIRHRPQSFFTVDIETHSKLLWRGPAIPEPLQPFGWMVHKHRSRSGYIARGGLHRVLAWPFLFKNYSVRDLAEFLEIYGLPARVGKYSPGADDRDKATLLKALVEIGHNAAGIIPEGMSLEFLAAASGAADPFVVMMTWCENSVSKAILGGTLTAQPGDVGSRSLGEVHNEVRQEIRDSDARQIASAITEQLIYPIAVLSFGNITSLTRCPYFEFDTGEAEDLKLYADSLPKLVDYGAKIPLAWMQEKLRIPEPESDAEEIMASIKPPPPTMIPGQTPAAPADPGKQDMPPKSNPMPAAASAHYHTGEGCAVCSGGPAPAPDALDGLREIALDGWKPLMKPITAPIAQALADGLERGESIAQFMARLPGIMEAMDNTKLTDTLAKASFMARAAGNAGAEIE